MKLLVNTLLFFSFLAFGVWAAINLKPQGYVSDFAGVLSSDNKSALESAIGEIEKKTGAEIAVVTIKSLEGGNLEDYANELFNAWGIGKKGKDNGLLILVALQERKIRLEVGYGLEGALPDGRCGDIIRNIMMPRFKQGDYAGGLSAAVDAAGRIIGGENPDEVVPESKSGQAPPLFFIAIWQGFCVIFGAAVLGWLGFGIQAFLAAGCDITAWVLALRHSPYAGLALLAGLFIPFFSIFVLGMAATIAHALLKRNLKRYYGKNWKEHWPVWIGSASASSGSGGWSGGGGGFGGGSSGGGGASGGW